LFFAFTAFTLLFFPCKLFPADSLCLLNSPLNPFPVSGTLAFFFLAEREPLTTPFLGLLSPFKSFS